MAKNFEKLKDKWYKKLLDSGFNDIENPDGSLKAILDARTIANALQNKESREAYYSQAFSFLNENFETLTSLEYRVWNLHCEGRTLRTIAKTTRATFYRVRTIINKLQKLAGLRK